MNREDRADLVVELLERLASLRADTDFVAADEAHEIAVHMLNALAAGEANVGLEPERVALMRRIMLGARPDADRPPQIRSISIFLRSVAGTLGRNKETAVLIAKRMLASVDVRLAKADRSVILEAIQKIAVGGSTSGAMADLLLKTGALDTSPSQGRTALQTRIDKTLSASSQSFNWQRARVLKPFAAKSQQRAR